MLSYETRGLKYETKAVSPPYNTTFPPALLKWRHNKNM